MFPFSLLTFLHVSPTSWGYLPDLPQDLNGDSISDYGRLIELFLKAVRLCTTGATDGWSTKYLPTAIKFGDLLLRLRADAVRERPPTPSPRAISNKSAVEGMLLGMSTAR
jgi:hypothetical protein